MEFEVRDIINRLKQETLTFLERRGHRLNDAGKFRCPVPEHDDKNPSAALVPGSNVIKCFSCGFSGDIIHLAHMLDGRPLHGSEFLTDTLVHLCEELNVPYEPPELTEEQHYLMRAKRAYKEAATILIGVKEFPHELAARGWSREVCEQTYTGKVPNWDYMMSRMKLLGFSQQYLKEIDITSRFFNENTMVFTWCDVWGEPIGFSARDMRYRDGEQNPPNLAKFINTGSKSPTFKKGEHLYGIKWALGHTPIYITEGMPDVVTAHQNGFHNVVCVGGTSFTVQQLELLKKHGARDIILAMNSDKPGIEATKRSIDDVIAGNVGVRARVLDLDKLIPSGIKPDIDNLFKFVHDAHKLWANAELEDSFPWRLKHLAAESSKVEASELALNLVINEKNNVQRGLMLQQIMEVLELPRIDDLQRDMDTKLYAESYKFKEEVESLRFEATREVRTQDPKDFIERLATLGESADCLRTKFSAVDHDIEETLGFLTRYREELLTYDGVIRGFATNMPLLDATFSGIPKSGRMIGIAGEPSSGKSSYMHQLIWNLTRYNSDILVLLLTIDDNREVVFPRLVSIETGFHTDHVLSPKSLTQPEHTEQWNKAWNDVARRVNTHCLDIRDSSHGNTLDYFESWIRYARAKYPQKQILAVLDNFHKLEGFGADERIIYKRASARIHKLKTELSVTFICSMELIKTYGRDARMDDIAETKKILYDCDAVLHVHNDFQQRLGDSGYIWIDHNGVQKPVIRVRVWKNKIRGRLGTMWYNFDSDNSRFTELDREPEVTRGQTHRNAMETMAGPPRLPGRSNAVPR